MSFTIPEADYNKLRYDHCGTSGIDVVHQIGEELKKRTGRSFEIHFNSETKIITILDSEDVSDKTLKTIFQNLANRPWKPRVYKAPLHTHSDKQFLLLCQRNFTIMGDRDLKRRKDDASSDEEALHPDLPSAKCLRKVINTLQQISTE